jgi:hypothetical protein
VLTPGSGVGGTESDDVDVELRGFARQMRSGIAQLGRFAGHRFDRSEQLRRWGWCNRRRGRRQMDDHRPRRDHRRRRTGGRRGCLLPLRGRRRVSHAHASDDDEDDQDPDDVGDDIEKGVGLE